jgi:predicted nuclease with TOPRIM domain
MSKGELPMMADKNEFLRRVEEQLSEIHMSIHALKKKVENASAPEKPDLARRLDSLQQRYRFGVERLQELTETSDHVWEGLQDELELFWTQLTTG